MALITSVIVPDLTALKAIPNSQLVQGLPLSVTDYDGQNLPALYVYYTGTPFAIDGEPNVVISGDNLGYFLLVAASPVSANS